MEANVKVENESLPMPLDKMPQCWQDDMRMNSLFAPFRQRTVNPLDWDSKLKFWTHLIGDWCRHKNAPSFTLDDLRKAFQREGRTPLCFPTVLEIMLGNKELTLYSNFVNVPPEKSWTAWTVDLLVKKPVVWSFNKVKDSIVSPSPSKEDKYVHLEVAKNQGEALLAVIDDTKKGQLYDLDELSELCKGGTSSLKDLHLAVVWLRRQGKAAVSDCAESKCMLVKLATVTESKVTISELDLGVYALKRNEKALARNLEQLETEKQAAIDEARLYLKKNMRQVAKSCLRKKNELEKSIIKRASALENVQLLLSRIREAESDSKVFDAYKMGVAALKTTFKAAGLTEDSVAHTVTDVEEVLDIHAEIQATLSQPIGDSADEDLEGELAELLLSDTPSGPPPSGQTPTKPPKEEEEGEDIESRLRALRTSDFPEPPTTMPASKVGVRQPTRH